MARRSGAGQAWTFIAGTLAGLVTGAAMGWLATPRRRRRTLDSRLMRKLSHGREAPPVVVVPGLMGSQLIRPDGSVAWLNLGNAFGHHDIGLPCRLPFSRSRDDLRPGLLIGTDHVLPRAFGFTEYSDLLALLDGAGFEPGLGPVGLRYLIFSYDWRRDIVESARELERQLDALAWKRRDPKARFHLLGHSMGGLVIRYYLRYGGAPPRRNARVTWAGAHRIASAILVATPSGGALPALGAILSGSRVGLSYTTLAASVVARMPSVYELLPPPGTEVLMSPKGQPIEASLLDPETWERFRWGAFRPGEKNPTVEKTYLKAALKRARAFHDALARAPDTPCPVPVSLVGGDCLPTLTRAVAGEGPPGTLPRLEARNEAEQELMFEAGDGRVSRSSVLASHLPEAREATTGSGIPEATQLFFGGADHHGLYADPAFQVCLLRLMLGPAARVAPTVNIPGG